MQIYSLHFLITVNRRTIFVLFMIVCCLQLTSCSKEESTNNNIPVLQLKTNGIYTFADTAIAEGSQITIGLKAFANQGENLCNLLVISNDSIRLLDYGFNASVIVKDVLINKNSDSIQKLDFIIRNTKGLSTSLQIVLTKNGSAYKPIIYYPEITLGGQSNLTVGSFYSLGNGLVYNQNDASQNQTLINLLYFYHTLEFNTLASPGANVTGIYQGANAPEFWTLKNTTYFSRNTINIPTSSFDNASNDSLIIANTFINGGRKAKGLTSGQIWAFLTENNKFGLIKILEVNGQESGTVKIAVKMQQ